MERLLSTLLFVFLFVSPIIASSSENQVYIVYLGEHKGDRAFHEIEDYHHSYLATVKETEEEARASLLYSYKHTINGFAARLTPAQATILSDKEEVVSVFRSHPMKYKMHTTRSWEFVGLEEGFEPHMDMKTDNDESLLTKAKYGRNVIVGVLDSGFWPESQSFGDEDMGPIPKSWRGTCQIGDAFNSSHCNRKVIGARYYIKGYENHYGKLNRTIDYLSPRDKDGHGTHTSSTVGGRKVPEASFMGDLARGTASGGAPLVHLAMYKVCWATPGKDKVEGNTCFEEDMLAAMDDAINDGVHVISVSIGTTTSVDYAHDGIAIGALHAVKKGIVVACSAGNSGPHAATLSNTAPWMITVGASSLDRKFLAPVVLGNGLVIEGETITTYRLDNVKFPLVYAGDVSVPNIPQLAGQCLPNSLLPEKTYGKIVFCLRGNGTRVGKGMEVKRAGGIGYILGNTKGQGGEIAADPHVLPATAVGEKEALDILKYIKTTRFPAAKLLPASTVVGTSPAPFMASFTSRGPSIVDPTILKPDITAPGLNILAAWSEADSPTKLGIDDRRVKWNIYSGTSMSCPHVAAAAALLKAIHPTWSSAAIRSALTTTAGLKNNNESLITDSLGNPADPFQFGSGHLRPTKAADPGLIYDASYDDYLMYLCSLKMPGFDPSFKCPKNLPKTNDLNYPSLAISKLSGTVTVTRTVTNVGKGKSTYFATVKPPMGYNVKISPSTLKFKHIGQKKSFEITVEKGKDVNSKMGSLQEYEFGWLTWSDDGLHTVRSPIVVSSA